MVQKVIIYNELIKTVESEVKKLIDGSLQPFVENEIRKVDDLYDKEKERIMKKAREKSQDLVIQLMRQIDTSNLIIEVKI